MWRTHPVEVLFNSGTTHSFISARLVKTLRLVSTSRHSQLNIALANEKVANYLELFIDCLILIHGHDFLADLYKFQLIEFDIILGMDQLCKHQAHIDCLKWKVTFTGPKGERVVHREKPLEGGVRLITAFNAHKLLSRGREGFLCNVLETKAPKPSLKDIPIVQGFLDMFLEEILGML